MTNKQVTAVTAENPRYNNAETEEDLDLAKGSLAVARCNKTLSIPYHKVGRRVVYLKSDLDAYLASVRVG